MADDRAARLEYLDAAATLLWPTVAADARPTVARPVATGDFAVHADAPAGGRRAAPMVLLPGAARPRLLAPARPRRAAAAAVLRYTAQQGWRGRAGGAVVATTALLGGYRRSHDPRPGAGTAAALPTIDDLLSAILGEPVLTALPLSPARANRKPVLQVLDRRGRTVAFAKIAINPLTRVLVDAEAQTLAALAEADLDGLRVPRVLHHGDWGSQRLLLLRALPLGRRLAAQTPLLYQAMRTIAAQGLTGTETVAGQGYLGGLRERAVAGAARFATGAVAPGPVDADDAVADSTAGATAGATAAATPAGVFAEWLENFDAVVAATPADTLPVGGWHGDWTEWNCSRRRGGVQAWDWERFAPAVPLGFDELHFRFNHTVATRGTGFAVAAAELIEHAPRWLARWGVHRRAADATVALYLLEIGLRYLLDDPYGERRPAQIQTWALPQLRAHLARVWTRTSSASTSAAVPSPPADVTPPDTPIGYDNRDRRRADPRVKEP